MTFGEMEIGDTVKVYKNEVFKDELMLGSVIKDLFFLCDEGFNVFKINTKDIKCLEAEEVLMTERVYKSSESKAIHDSSISTSRNNMRATKTRRG